MWVNAFSSSLSSQSTQATVPSLRVVTKSERAVFVTLRDDKRQKLPYQETRSLPVNLSRVSFLILSFPLFFLLALVHALVS